MIGAALTLGAGSVLAVPTRCHAQRWAGIGLLGAVLLALPRPALADQSLLVADNGLVQCEASLRDLTRISLKDDQFASVSKIATGIASEDFTVVNEPVRGDIYLSVPDGFTKRTISFFGTTRRGYVYKFACTLAGDEARQVFIANADIEHPAAAAEAVPANLSQQDAATRLVRAMAEQLPVDGFDVAWKPLAPVMAGTLRVQALGEYRGVTLVGKVVRVENRGTKAVTLREDAVAPADAIAVSIAHAELAPGQVTTAYIVEAGPSAGGRP